MDNTQIDIFLKQMAAQTTALASISRSLELIARGMAPKAPAYVRAIAEFTTFDWEAIGATVTKSDAYGPAIVDWGGYTWTRRCPENKFGEAIWFSRPDGKGEDGNTRYVRLVTFKAQTDAEPISRKVESTLQSNPPARSAQPAAAINPRSEPTPKSPAPVTPAPAAPASQSTSGVPAGTTRPTAAPTNPPAANQHRPWAPQYLKEKVKSFATITYQNRKATAEERRKLEEAFTSCFVGMENYFQICRGVQYYLTGVGPGGELPDNQVLALLQWLGPRKDPTGHWQADPLAIAEATAIVETITIHTTA